MTIPNFSCSRLWYVLACW